MTPDEWKVIHPNSEVRLVRDGKVLGAVTSRLKGQYGWWHTPIVVTNGDVRELKPMRKLGAAKRRVVQALTTQP